MNKSLKNQTLMVKSNKIVAIIPAKGGSKSIPKKSIVDLGGFPLIAYSIAAAKLSKMIDRVVVVTDSEEMADIAQHYGAEAPFLQPENTLGTDLFFIKYTIDWLKEHENFEPEFLFHLRPTTPLRNPELIDQAIEMIKKNTEASSLRSAHELAESPHKFFEIRNGFFEGLFPEDSALDAQNTPRQSFPIAYHPNGYVDVLKTNTVRDLRSIHGRKILPLITEFLVELDRPSDLDYIKFDLQRGNYEIYNYLKNGNYQN